MKLLLTIFAIIFVFTKSQDIACHNQGVYVPNYGCSCFSRYYGSNCANTTSPQNCTINTPSKLKVDFYPTLVPGSSGLSISSYLTIAIRLPVVYNRFESQISIQNSPMSYCNFPGPFATQEHDNTSPCYNIVRFNIAWDSYAYNCSWSKTKTETEEFHKGYVLVNQRERAGTLGGVPYDRTVHTTIPIQIKFVNSIAIAGNINYQTNPIVDALITKLGFVKGPPSYGIIEFVTSTDFPHLINSTAGFTITSTNPGLNFSITELTDYNNCPNSGSCTQKFQVIMNANSTTCTFTGIHQVMFQYGCHHSTSSCSPSISTISLDINSEDFCSTSTVNVGLSTQMTTYKDPQFAFPSNNFATDNFVYAKLRAWANVQIVAVELQRFQWTSNVTTRVLFDNFNITNDGIAANFVGNGTQIKFQLINSQVSNLNHGAPVVLSANIIVSYKGSPQGDILQSNENVKWFVKDSSGILSGLDGTQTAKTTSNILLNSAVTSGGAKETFGIFVLMVSLIFSFFFQ